MKITLTDEQVNSLVEVEIKKRTGDNSDRYEKELLKVQTQLTNALSIVNNLLSNQVVKTKKEKLTDEQFVSLWNEGLSNNDIAIKTGYNAGYISLFKRKLIESGKIEERKK